MTDLINADWNENDASNTGPSPNGIAGSYAPSSIAPTVRAIRGALKRAYREANALYTTSGTGAAYTVQFEAAPAAYAKGVKYNFYAHADNTGPCSINVNSLGPKSILRQDGSALSAGQIKAGALIEVAFNGTSFVLLSAVAHDPAFTGNLSVTGTAFAGGLVVNGTMFGADNLVMRSGSGNNNKVIHFRGSDDVTRAAILNSASDNKILLRHLSANGTFLHDFGFTQDGDLEGVRNLSISGTFTGNGSGLSALNGSNISTGTVADARLPATMSAKTFATQIHIKDAGNKHIWFRNASDVARALIYHSEADNNLLINHYNANGVNIHNYIFNELGDVSGVRNMTVGSVSGNGTGLTSLNGSNISTGTVADARLPSFLSEKTFDSTINIRGGGNKHIWFRNGSEVNRGLLYHSEGDNAFRFQYYHANGAFKSNHTFEDNGNISGVRDLYMSGTVYNGDARYQNDGNIYMPWAGTHLSTVLAGKLNLSGGNLSGTLGLAGYGSNFLANGTADGASYTSYNFKIRGHFGLGMETYDGTINGFYDFRAGKWDTKGGFFKNGTEAVYNNGGTYNIGISGTAGVANKLFLAGGGTATFNWSGQGGQPQWLWGANGVDNSYLYNPANFSVNYATTAGNANNLGGQNIDFFRNGSNINAGTIADARLPGTFSSKTIAGNLTLTGNAPIINLSEDTGAGIANWYIVGDNSGLTTRYGDLASIFLDMSPTGTFKWLGNTIWHSGNDGAGSGLDADLLDGQDNSFYRNASNINAGTLADARLPGTMSAKTINDSIYIRGGGNKHVWFHNGSGVARGLIYHSEGDNALRMLQYNANGAVIHEYTFTDSGDVGGMRYAGFGGSIGVGGAGTGAGDFANGKGIAIGDNDTGIRQNGDGILELWTNNQSRFQMNTAQAHFYNLSSGLFVNNSLVVTNNGGNYGINISGASAYAAGAGNAASADKALRLTMQGAGADANFNWSGQGGQPQWLWGGNDATNMYVYNPSGFSVSYASTAGNANNLGGVGAGDFLQTSQFRGNLGAIGVDEVGAVAVFTRVSAATLNQGDTSLGSQLRYSNFDGTNVSTNAPSGTWRLLSRLIGGNNNLSSVGLFRRIS